MQLAINVRSLGGGENWFIQQTGAISELAVGNINK
jgi:hypothetical protein